VLSFTRAASFTQRLAVVLTVIAIAVCAGHADAATSQKARYRAATSLKVPCSRSDVRCLRQGSKPIAAMPKAEAEKKQPGAKRIGKPAGKPRVVKARRSQKNIRLAVRPKRKPVAPKPMLPEPARENFMPEIVLHVPHPPAPRIETTASLPSYGDDCRDELARLGADFSVSEDIKGTGVCHVAKPVQLRSVLTSAGRVELPGTPLLNCAFAQQFVMWLSDVAAPLIAGAGGARIASLSTGTSYQCRTRNGDLSGKMSEHAFGNAIDIAGITLTDERRVEITATSVPQAPDRRLLAALRASACGYFSTVLGPGADGAHDSHLHFDLGVHGVDGTYRICN
jgi:hypothetical protein